MIFALGTRDWVAIWEDPHVGGLGSGSGRCQADLDFSALLCSSFLAIIWANTSLATSEVYSKYPVLDTEF